MVQVAWKTNQSTTPLYSVAKHQWDINNIYMMATAKCTRQTKVLSKVLEDHIVTSCSHNNGVNDHSSDAEAIFSVKWSLLGLGNLSMEEHLGPNCWLGLMPGEAGLLSTCWRQTLTAATFMWCSGCLPISVHWFKRCSDMETQCSTNVSCIQHQ